MEKTEKDSLFLVLFLTALFFIDMIVVSGIFIHGKANFIDLYKNLK